MPFLLAIMVINLYLTIYLKREANCLDSHEETAIVGDAPDGKTAFGELCRRARELGGFAVAL